MAYAPSFNLLAPLLRALSNSAEDFVQTLPEANQCLETIFLSLTFTTSPSYLVADNDQSSQTISIFNEQGKVSCIPHTGSVAVFFGLIFSRHSIAESAEGVKADSGVVEVGK